MKKQDILVKGSSKNANKTEKQAAIKATNWIEENQIEIQRVVLKTGPQDQLKSYMEPLGLSYAQKQNISALDNLAFLDTELLSMGKQILRRAKGYYKYKTLKCFDPVFWVEFIIFLPKEILKYFSIDENAKFGSLSIKIMQIIYWIASIIFMYERYLHGD